MIKFLYASGDSFVFGDELNAPGNPHIYDFTGYHRKHCYSGIIADQLGIANYKNEALPGGSNERVYRKLITSIPETLKSFSPNEIFVHISLTHATRREFYINERKKWYPHILSYKPKKEDSEHCLQLWELLSKEFSEDTGAYIFDTMMILAIQNFLLMNKIPYLLTFSMDTLQDRKVRNQIDKLISPETLNQLNFNRIYGEKSFHQFTEENNFKRGKQNHPLEDAHKAWATFLMEYIDTNKLLTV